MRCVSERTVVSFPTYQRYETGATTIPIPELLAVSSIIGVKPADILNEAIGMTKAAQCRPRSIYGLFKRIEKMPNI